MLEIIPAIDLRGGKAVRLQRGEFGTEARVAEDPVKVALKFEEQGAPRLHVVDLDGARVGTPQNVPVIREIIRKLTIPVQVGGGLRDIMLAERILQLGAARIIIGTTAAAQDERLIREMLAAYSSRVIIGADAKEGYVAVNGWTLRTGETITDFGKRLVQMGAQRFLFTDIARDGMLEGVNVEATQAFAQAVGVPVLASGGVSGPEDISLLAKAQPEGIEGVIIGKAFYAGRLTLADALRLAADDSDDQPQQ